VEIPDKSIRKRTRKTEDSEQTTTVKVSDVLQFTVALNCI